MTAFTDIFNDVEDGVDEVTDFLTGDSLGDAADDLLSSVQNGDNTLDLDDALPILGTLLGGPFGSASILSVATDLLTGQTIDQLIGDGLDLWFDRDDYLTRNSDVADASVDPFLHFVQSGALEARLPEIFDEAFYLASNPDVGAAVSSNGFASGWEHFLTNGSSEGRLPIPGASGDLINAINGTLNQLRGSELL